MSMNAEECNNVSLIIISYVQTENTVNEQLEEHFHFMFSIFSHAVHTNVYTACTNKS